MQTINTLIQDELEAIRAYKEFIAQQSHTKRVTFKIQGIIRDEERHIKLLRKMR